MFFVLVAVFFGVPLLIGGIAYFQKRGRSSFYAQPSGNDTPGEAYEAGLHAGFPLKHP
jgi:hypothetical protein